MTNGVVVHGVQESWWSSCCVNTLKLELLKWVKIPTTPQQKLNDILIKQINKKLLTASKTKRDTNASELILVLIPIEL